MKVVVKLLSGSSVVLEATPQSLVYDLKEQLRAMQSEPMRVELLFEEKSLENSKTMKDLEDLKNSKNLKDFTKRKDLFEDLLELSALFLPDDTVQVPGDVAAEAFKGSTLHMAEVLGKSIGREAFRGGRVLSMFTHFHFTSLQMD